MKWLCCFEQIDPGCFDTVRVRLDYPFVLWKKGLIAQSEAA
jgi:hypothetical protein